MRGTPTAYFLGKVCIAKHIEPIILEECLINKLSYHYEHAIVDVRLCRQVKTIQAMAELLESYELESYYWQSQFRNYTVNRKPRKYKNEFENKKYRNIDKKPQVNCI